METDTRSSAETSDGEPSAVDCVLDAVADRKSVTPLDLPPLYDAVDPEALDALFASATAGRVRVELAYAGCDVVLETGRELRCTVTDADQ